MKSKNLDKAGNKIELGGEIDPNYVIRPGVTITFAEGATFQGERIKLETFYNNEYVPKKFEIASLGELTMIPMAPRPGTPYPGGRSEGEFFPSDEVGDIGVSGDSSSESSSGTSGTDVGCCMPCAIV